ncbi:hypothetical protein V8G54_024284 [Vigna mungo]|uniref:Uncharacterized protein n=1 Tax=Vigna mungo TaxID=3915 RepID=A0AAQ3N736_VIGMU
MFSVKPSSMFSVTEFPFILSKLSPPSSTFESTSSSNDSGSASLSGENSFFSILQLSHILNSTSTESSFSFLSSSSFTFSLSTSSGFGDAMFSALSMLSSGMFCLSSS